MATDFTLRARLINFNRQNTASRYSTEASSKNVFSLRAFLYAFHKSRRALDVCLIRLSSRTAEPMPQ